MSRIVKCIVVPSNILLNYKGNVLDISGPKGVVFLKIHNLLDIAITEIASNKELFVVEKQKGSMRNDSLLGTFTILIRNCIHGVLYNHEKKLKMLGVGYKVVADNNINNNNLILHLGFSHPILYKIPKGITVNILDNNELLVFGVCKQQVGQVSAEIRSKRPPELYKGKGIRYINENIILKEGKKK